MFSLVTREGLSGSGVAIDAKLLSMNGGVKTDSTHSPEDIGDKSSKHLNYPNLLVAYTSAFIRSYSISASAMRQAALLFFSALSPISFSSLTI